MSLVTAAVLLQHRHLEDSIDIQEEAGDVRMHGPGILRLAILHGLHCHGFVKQSYFRFIGDFDWFSQTTYMWLEKFVQDETQPVDIRDVPTPPTASSLHTTSPANLARAKVLPKELCFNKFIRQSPDMSYHCDN